VRSSTTGNTAISSKIGCTCSSLFEQVRLRRGGQRGSLRDATAPAVFALVEDQANQLRLEVLVNCRPGRRQFY
jgi:hypothetical protein